MEHDNAALRTISPLRAWLVAAVALITFYTVTMENGALLADGAQHLHELFHDGRHFLGVPCH